MTISQLEARLNQVEGQGRAALANLQDQFDTLAAAHAEALADMRVMATTLAAVQRSIIDPRTPPDTAEFVKFVLPTDNAPKRWAFDAAGLLGAIAERQTR